MVAPSDTPLQAASPSRASEAPGPALPLSPPLAWALVVAATSTMAVSYVDRQAVAVLGPTLTRELHLSEVEFGWLGSAFALAYLVSAPLGGGWIDRVGARRGLLLSVFAWSLVAAGHGLVGGLGSLLLLRVLLGVTESPAFPAAAQTLSRALPAQSRDTAFGILFTGSSVGAALSAVLVPRLDAWLGWRLALAGTALVGLCWFPLWLWVTSRPGAHAALEPQERGDSNGTPAQREPRGGEETRARTGRGGAVGRLLGRRAQLRAMVAIVSSAPAIGFVLQWGAKLLVGREGVVQAEVGHYLWLPPLAFDAGAVLFGLASSRRLQRQAPSVPLAAPRALVAMSALLTLLLALLPLVRGPWQVTALLGLCLLGGGGLYALITGDLVRRVAPDEVATAGGLSAAAQSLAQIVAFPLIGLVVGRTHSYDTVAVGLGLWLLPGALAWLAWEPGRR
jgi:ACS family hexuronate transporter-like MFS transporter